MSVPRSFSQRILPFLQNIMFLVKIAFISMLRFDDPALSDMQLSNMRRLQRKCLEDTTGYKIMMSEVEDVCDWEGVECDNSGIVVEIYWRPITYTRSYMSKVLRSLRYFPPTVRLIHVYHLGVENQEHFFRMRDFPRETRTLHIQHCDVWGVLCFESAPIHLQSVNLFGNSLSGTVHLARLPPNLRHLDLRENQIRRIYFRKGTFPTELLDGFHAGGKVQPHVKFV